MKEIQNLNNEYFYSIPENYDECITLFCDNCKFYTEYRKSVFDCEQYIKFRKEKFKNESFDLPI